MLVFVQSVLLVWLALAAPAVAALAGEADISGLWRGSFYGSDVQARVEQDPDHTVRAEVVVHALTGETNVYHLVGAIFGGHIYMLHGSGHVFEGEAKGDAITGVLTTKGGSRLELSATKVPLPPSRACPPISGTAGPARQPG
uniref:Uncharacterized protein n=1 Tax=Desulfovibrio sp. U5L TaxID=596152 RepID=I2PYB8_9BACT